MNKMVTWLQLDESDFAHWLFGVTEGGYKS